MKELSLMDRRRWLTTSGAAMAAIVTGCPQPSQTDDVKSSSDARPSTSSVPLRLLMVGDEATADAVRRGWGGVSEQPLTIELIGDDGRQTSIDSQALLDAAGKTDLIWFPRFLLADLVTADRLDVLKDDSTIEFLSGMYAPLRSGLSQYASQTYCLPLGPAVPGVLSVDPVEAATTWEEYDERVKTDWKGQASEPTAAGWAAMMFLWRCNGRTKRWLFDQNTFAPVINTEPYVDALEQMRKTCQRYTQLELTPQDVFLQVCEGKLAGGIGFPGLVESSESVLSSVSTLPVPKSKANASTRNLFDVMSPSIGIAESCRQTLISKTFMHWIAGGPSSEGARSTMASVFSTGGLSVESEPSENRRTYDTFRAGSLQSPLSAPGMTFLHASEYYQVLDQSVRQCVDGKLSAEQTLADVAKQWEQLTNDIGREQQTQTWLYGKRA